MEKLEVQGETLFVDVRGELEVFEWQRATWKGDKLIATSPFRPDNTPSFFVRLEAGQGYEAGVWGDSGAHDDSYSKGGFVSLLAYLRRESWHETELYLLEKYGTRRERTQQLKPPQLRSRQKFKSLNSSESVLVAKSAYLTRRGIAEHVQLQAKIGKPLLLGVSGFVALPLYNARGELCNIKYRSTTGKQFFYERDAQPISELVFGAELYLQHKGALVICEAEIDALSWRTAGIAAVSVGGSALSKTQADFISRLPCEYIILAGDNDKAGMKLQQRAQTLITSKRLSVVNYEGLEAKDANDILLQYGSEQLVNLARTAVAVPLKLRRE